MRRISYIVFIFMDVGSSVGRVFKVIMEFIDSDVVVNYIFV